MRFLKTPSISLLGLSLVVCALGVPALAGQPPAITPSHRLDRLVAADLDGDRKLDIGTLSASHRDGANFVQSVTVQFNSNQISTFQITTAQRAQFLSWRDLDSDADRDLIVEGCDRQPLAVLLNDGHGHFQPGSVADYLERLRQHRSTTLETPRSASDSDGLAESAPSSPVALGLTDHRPELVSSSLFVRNPRMAMGSFHIFRSSRAPPSLQ